MPWCGRPRDAGGTDRRPPVPISNASGVAASTASASSSTGPGCSARRARRSSGAGPAALPLAGLTTLRLARAAGRCSWSARTGSGRNYA